MRIALVIYGPLDDRSGGYLYDSMLVRHLRARGDEVEIVSLPERGYAASFSDNFSRALAARLRGGRWDAVLEDELNHPSLFLLNRRLREQIRCPIIAVTHHLRCSELPPGGGKLLCRFLEKRYLATVDGCVCNSRSTVHSVGALAGRRLPSVAALPGKDGRPYAIDRDTVAARLSGGGPLRIIYVGAVIPRKGLHVLVEALARIPDRPWTLEVVGSCSVDPRYAALVARQAAGRSVAGRIRFAGRLDDRELGERLRGAHILAVPSFFEGCGIAYIEALGCGLPVIGAAAGGAAEIVRHAVEGFLVAPGDSRAVAACIRRLDGDRGLLGGMSLNALRRFAELPGWDESMAAARGFIAACAGRREGFR